MNLTGEEILPSNQKQIIEKKEDSQKKKKKNSLTLKNAIVPLNGRQRGFNTFESRIFPGEKQGKGLILKK